MKYYLSYEFENESGAAAVKWIPSNHYELSAEHLLTLLKGKRNNRDMLIIPLVLTLCASLEANLNDWIIIDCFQKHGPEHYKKLAEGYMTVPLSKKLRIAVSVMTDNSFQLKEESEIVRLLDELIATRNKITHAQAHFRVLEAWESEQGRRQTPKHVLFSLTVKQCRNFQRAVRALERKFFGQYDKGFIKENDLIRELKRIGDQIA
jgi:hypothetical protein